MNNRLPIEELKELPCSATKHLIPLLPRRANGFPTMNWGDHARGRKTS
ncbi:MAG: hypothetical protein ABJA66_12815 [Actinomycetota bacterium]